MERSVWIRGWFNQRSSVSLLFLYAAFIASCGLFSSKRLNRIHSRRPPGRNHTRQQRDYEQHSRDDRKYHRISWRRIEQQWLDPSTRVQRDHRSYHNANNREPDAVSHDQANDVADLRAKRDPNTQLVSALFDEIRDHAIQPDGRNEQREPTKYREHRGAESPGANLRVE